MYSTATKHPAQEMFNIFHNIPPVIKRNIPGGRMPPVILRNTPGGRIPPVTLRNTPGGRIPPVI